MKVDANPEIARGDYAVKNNTDPKTTGSEFSTILEESLKGVSNENTTVSQGSKIDGISKTQFDLFHKPENSAIGQVENYLNMLSEYQEKLGNPDVTLKELSPLLNQMNAEKGQLSSTLDSLSDEDELKGIVNETLILSSLETIKFNRGDYNPQ
ncbi:MAG: hypothetical protein K9N10_10300 [Deltaproteobacteria bacterium]|nr:hypothetical protein [Deltaproteobacteria bacterium]